MNGYSHTQTGTYIVCAKSFARFVVLSGTARPALKKGGFETRAVQERRAARGRRLAHLIQPRQEFWQLP
jgi:hypothetical protein